MERDLRLSDLDTKGASGHIAVAAIYPRDRSRPRTPVTYTHALELAGGNSVVYSAFGPAEKDKPIKGLRVLHDLDPETAELEEDATGLVLTGGGDIDPACYGQTPHPRTHNISARRDTFEMNLLGQALERDIPVLAICRGMQLLNVFLGGTLDQHIADTEGRLDHDRDRPRAEPAHGVRFEQGNFLTEELGKHANVNSHHHQGLDEIADELEEIGWADDGVLEAVVVPRRSWVYGVQWHPEAMASVHHEELEIFRRFVAATEEVATRSAPSVRSA